MRFCVFTLLLLPTVAGAGTMPAVITGTALAPGGTAHRFGVSIQAWHDKVYLDSANADKGTGQFRLTIHPDLVPRSGQVTLTYHVYGRVKWPAALTMRQVPVNTSLGKVVVP